MAILRTIKTEILINVFCNVKEFCPILKTNVSNIVTTTLGDYNYQSRVAEISTKLNALKLLYISVLLSIPVTM